VGWLIPRLIDFQKKHPEIQVHINSSHVDADFQRSEVDVCVLMGYKVQPEVHYEYLFTSEIFPVCSPKLLEEGPKLKKPKDLVHHNLLYINHAEQDWPNWFTAAGEEEAIELASKGIRFDSYSLGLDAAMDGAGVALALSPFGMSDIRAGRLINPFDIKAPAYGDWYLAYRENRRNSAKVNAFQKWLLEQVGADPDMMIKQAHPKG